MIIILQSTHFTREQNYRTIENPILINWDCKWLPREGEWFNCNDIIGDKMPHDLMEDSADMGWTVLSVRWVMFENEITPSLILEGK